MDSIPQILIVEDSTLHGPGLLHLLGRRFRCKLERDFDVAHGLIHEWRGHLPVVILDMGELQNDERPTMNLESGYNLLVTFCGPDGSLKRPSDPAFIVWTIYGGDVAMQRMCLEAGAIAYLDKLGEPDELGDLLENTIRNWQSTNSIVVRPLTIEERVTNLEESIATIQKGVEDIKRKLER